MTWAAFVCATAVYRHYKLTGDGCDCKTVLAADVGRTDQQQRLACFVSLELTQSGVSLSHSRVEAEDALDSKPAAG
jgi:hypothetical protein